MNPLRGYPTLKDDKTYLFHIRDAIQRIQEYTVPEFKLELKESFDSNIGLSQNGSQGAFGDVPGMIGDGGSTFCYGVIPDFVTALGLPVEYETCFPKFTEDFIGPKRRKTTHLPTQIGTWAWALARRASTRNKPLGNGYP